MEFLMNFMMIIDCLFEAIDCMLEDGWISEKLPRSNQLLSWINQLMLENFPNFFYRMLKQSIDIEGQSIDPLGNIPYNRLMHEDNQLISFHFPKIFLHNAPTINCIHVTVDWCPCNLENFVKSRPNNAFLHWVNRLLPLFLHTFICWMLLWKPYIPKIVRMDYNL